MTPFQKHLKASCPRLFWRYAKFMGWLSVIGLGGTFVLLVTASPSPPPIWFILLFPAVALQWTVLTAASAAIFALTQVVFSWWQAQLEELTDQEPDSN